MNIVLFLSILYISIFSIDSFSNERISHNLSIYFRENYQNAEIMKQVDAAEIL